jgi:hypothetical protein
MLLVKVNKTDKRLKVKKDEIYAAQRYLLDPAEKCTLLHRLPDGYNPMCNQYFTDIEVLGNFNPTSRIEKRWDNKDV